VVAFDFVKRYHISPMKTEQQIRTAVRNYITELYKVKHAPKEFIPGKTLIPYAGRVFDEKEIQALVDSALDFWLTLGPQGEEFEKKLARYVGVRFCSLVNSGSSANLLAFGSLTSPLLKDRRIHPGSEVITLAAGFPTTISPIIQYNCIPVFVDIDETTKNIQISQMDQALSKKTKAVMIAHTLGNPFDVQEVCRFCQKHDLYLVEDNCDALGSEYNGKKTGSFGHLATQSFYPAHQITMGEGGAVLTENAILKRAVESLRDWGRDCWCESGKDNTCGKRFTAQHGELPFGYDHKYVYSHFGYNLKPLDLQAAIGRVQLDKLPAFVEARRQNFNFFYQALKPYEDIFILPEPTLRSNPCWFGFALTIRDHVSLSRDEIVHYLEKHKIQTRTLFTGNIIRQPLFDEHRKSATGYRVIGDLPNTERVMNNTFWFGVYPGLLPQQREYVVEMFTRFFKEQPKKVLANNY